MGKICSELEMIFMCTLHCLKVCDTANKSLQFKSNHWGMGECGFLKSNAKRESVASLTKKKSKRVPIDDAKKSFIDHA